MIEKRGHLPSPAEVMAALVEATGDPAGVTIETRAWPELPVPGALGAAAYARVREFVEGHLGEHVSLDDLAAVAGISRFHFARQFRLRTGQSPMAYVLRSRVERSKAMLRTGGASVGEVAVALGFADQSHFTRTFRRLVGTTPRLFSTRREGIVGESGSP